MNSLRHPWLKAGGTLVTVKMENLFLLTDSGPDSVNTSFMKTRSLHSVKTYPALFYGIIVEKRSMEIRISRNKYQTIDSALLTHNYAL